MGLKPAERTVMNVCFHPDENAIPSLMLTGPREESGDKPILPGLAWKFSCNTNIMNELRSEWGRDCILREDTQYFIVLW